MTRGPDSIRVCGGSSAPPTLGLDSEEIRVGLGHSPGEISALREPGRYEAARRWAWTRITWPNEPDTHFRNNHQEIGGPNLAMNLAGLLTAEPLALRRWGLRLVLENPREEGGVSR